MENLARYIIRASFSQERMTYHRQQGQVEYRSKDGKQVKTFEALLSIRNTRLRPIFNVPCLGARVLLPKFTHLSEIGTRSAVDIMPVIGHIRLERERLDAGRRADFGPATSWGAHYIEAQFEKSLFSALEREFLSSEYKCKKCAHRFCQEKRL